MQKRTGFYTLILCLVISSIAFGTNYYVSPTGDDNFNGLTTDSAWLSIDNGEQGGTISPGDTVFIMSGTYTPSGNLDLATSGTLLAPIVYTRFGKAASIIDKGGSNQPAVRLTGDHLEFRFIEVTNANDDGIRITGDSCDVYGCYVNNVSQTGILVSGSGNLILRNTIYLADGSGILNEDAALDTRIFGNTVYSNGLIGIKLQSSVQTARVFNNIISDQNKGISGAVENICGFNNVWGNPGGNYVDGVVDSAGGVSKTPKFVDPAGGRFDLKIGDFGINTGLDIGYDFNGVAPDMGAIEKYNAYYVSPSGNDAATGNSPATAWSTIGNGDSLLLPGDTVYVAAGAYSSQVIVSDGGEGKTDLIFFKGVPDSTTLDGSAFNEGVIINGSYVYWLGISVSNSIVNNINLAAEGCVIESCLIADAGGYGIVSANGCNLYFNVIADNAVGGVDVSAGNQLKFLQNTFYNNGNYGCKTGGNSNWFKNNIFEGHDSSAVVAGVNSSIKYCIFHNNLANSQGGVSVSTGSIIADPLLVDPANGNFGLAVSSPAIDSGVDLGLGYPFFGSAPDMGAIEFDPSGNQPPILAAIGSKTVEEGQSLNFTVSASDSDGVAPGLSVQDLPANASFADSGDGTGTFDFNPDYTQAGIFNVLFIASDGVQSDSETVAITVTPAPVAYINVVPDSNNVEQSDSVQFSALGYDAGSELVKDLTDSVTWSTTDATGSITAGGLYSAGTNNSPPDYYIKAVYNSFSDSGLSTVISAGVVDHIHIEFLDGTIVGDTSWTTDNDTTTVYCRGYNVGDVLQGDVSVTWSILGVDTIGTLSTTIGTSVLLTLNKLGTGKITAEYSASIKDSTGTITCTSGKPASLVVTPGTATVSSDSTLMFNAGSYDADGFPSTPGVIVGWSVLGEIGTIAFNGLLTPTTVSTGYIVAFGSGLADTTSLITVTPGTVDYIVVSPDSVLVSSDSTKQFTALGYDTDNNLADAGVITWTLVGVAGSVDSTGLFDATTVGSGKIIATSSFGPVDTNAYLGVSAGQLVTLTVSPDSTEVSADSTFSFSVAGVDADGNNAALADVEWQVVGTVGDIDSTGLFSAGTAGMGKIAATSSINLVTDTNLAVVVVPGSLAQLVISPHTQNMKIAETQQFSTDGYDSNNNLVAFGTLTWGVVGSIGTIDANGLFTATSSGAGNITVLSSLGGITDTTGIISVEILNVSSIPLGNSTVSPGDKNQLVLALLMRNDFAGTDSIIGLTLRDGSQGVGTPAELQTNIDSVSLYLDKDGDSILTAADSIIAKGVMAAGTISFTFDPIAVPPSSEVTMFGCIDISMLAHDSDSLDLFLLPSTDVITVDSSAASGLDTVNSLGYSVVDGMVAGQVKLVPTGQTVLTPGDSIYLITSFDLPRNGYLADTLKMLQVRNFGTAVESDFDSIMVYADDGDNLWNGPGVETMLYKLVFTGSLWMRSGMNVALTSPMTRFYIGADLSTYPVNGKTVALGFPTNAFSMASANDGPIDAELQPVDTMTIQTSESVDVQALSINTRDLVPGESSGALLAFDLINSYGFTANLDSVLVQMILDDPNGATQAELDSQIDSLALWLDRDGDYQTIGPLDSMLSVATVLNGVALISTSGLAIPGGGGTARLTLSVWLSSTKARDGNSVNLSIQGGSSFYFAQAVSITGSLPLQNGDDFNINGFSSASVSVYAVAGQTLFGGQTDQVVLDFSLPGNGYATDELRAITLQNNGSLVENDALTAMTLWNDIGGNGYSADDLRLGVLTYRLGLWELDGLALPVSDAGIRLIVTIDVGAGQFQAGTLKMQLAVGGAIFRSGMTGPDDLPVGNPNEHIVFPSDRITAISIPLNPADIYPGSTGNDLLTFALYNGYTSQNKILQALTLTNRSITSSDTAFSDFEVGQISFYYDNDGSRTFNGDTLIAVGRLSGGKLLLSGLNITLMSEQLSYFFVVCDIPTLVTDGDSLSVAIAEPSDFVFALDQSGAVNLNGDMPLTRGSYLTINGSVRSQYGTVPFPPATVTPGDSNLTLFTFSPAANGYWQDTLESVTIVNTWNADTSDIANLEIWVDRNGDSTWQLSDSLIGAMTFNGSGWSIGSMSLPVDSMPPILMIIGDITGLATSGQRFRGSIPINGCTYRSGNDGPLDLPVLSAGELVISTAGLQISYTLPGVSLSVGQQFELKFTATNQTAGAMDSVYGIALIAPADSSKVLLDSAVAGSFSLLPLESQEFVFYYTAQNSGTLSWQLLAVNQVVSPDSSATVTTTAITIQDVPAGALVQLVNSIPTSVTKGQLNVFPLILSITHPDTSSTIASLRLDSLTLRIDDGFGNDLLADSVFSRLVLANGYTNLTIMQTVPNSATITMSFSSPVIIMPGESKNLSLLIDIDSMATASNFAISVTNAAGVPLVDENSSLVISLDSSVSFPMATASCRVDEPSQVVLVSSTPLLSANINYGQINVDVSRILLRHPGLAGSSQIQISGITIQFVDSINNPISAGSLADRVRIKRQQTVIAELSSFDLTNNPVYISLNSPVTLSAGDQDSITVQVWVRSLSTYSGFGMLITDSTSFVVRDLSSGSPLVIATDTLILASGSAFPMASGFATLKQPSAQPDICLTSVLPSSIVGGRDSLDLISIGISYPSGGEFSPVTISEALVTVLDGDGKPIDPTELFDRVGMRRQDGTIYFQPFVELRSGKVVFQLDTYGVNLEPGDSTTISLVGSIESAPEIKDFLLSMQIVDAFTLYDATDTTHLPGFVQPVLCAATFPFVTLTTDILLPAGRPSLEPKLSPVQIVFAGQKQVSLFRASLDYQSAVPLGDLKIGGLNCQVLKRTTAGLEPIDASLVFDTVRMKINDQIVAVDSLPTGDSLKFIPTVIQTLALGDDYSLELTCDIKADAPAANYVIQFGDSTFLDISDKNLLTKLYPTLVGASYPLNTAELSLTVADLGSSFSNYPNPFLPSEGEETTISFVLRSDAYVDIELYSITGHLVKVVTSNSMRSAGAHDRDKWNGTNGSGQDVVPGVYYCRITAAYLGGSTEVFQRKVAVLR